MCRTLVWSPIFTVRASEVKRNVATLYFTNSFWLKHFFQMQCKLKSLILLDLFFCAGKYRNHNSIVSRLAVVTGNSFLGRCSIITYGTCIFQRHNLHVYSVSQKSSHLKLSAIFSLRLSIFLWNFIFVASLYPDMLINFGQSILIKQNGVNFF